MADELYDESFEIHYPCWLLVRKDCIERQADGSARFIGRPTWLQLHNEEGVASVPVFTDEFNALSFCEASGLVDDAEMIAEANAESLADTLRVIHGTDGTERVVFDPPRADAVCGHVYPIGYVIRQLRAGKNLL